MQSRTAFLQLVWLLNTLQKAVQLQCKKLLSILY